jgi:hypothetical protein
MTDLAFRPRPKMTVPAGARRRFAHRTLQIQDEDVDDSLFTYAPMDFKVKLGFPLLAKVLLGTGVLLAMGLILGAARWARKIRFA